MAEEVTFEEVLKKGINNVSAVLAEETVSQIIEYLSNKCYLRQLLPVIRAKSETIKIPKITGVIEAKAIGSAGSTIPESDITFDTLEITVKKLGVLCKIPTEYDETAIVDIGRLVAEDLARAIAEGEEEAFLLGDPASYAAPDVKSMFTGLVKGAGTTVDKAKNELTKDDILNAIAALNEKNLGRNIGDLVLLCNPYVAAKIKGWSEVITVDKYGPKATIVTGEIGSIFGVKIIQTNFLQRRDYSDSDDTQVSDVILFDRNEAAVIVDLRRMTIRKEYDINTDTNIIQVTERIGFAVKRADAIYVWKNVLSE